MNLPAVIPACRCLFEKFKYKRLMIRELAFIRNEGRYLQLTIAEEPVLNIRQLFSMIYMLATDQEARLVGNASFSRHLSKLE